MTTLRAGLRFGSLSQPARKLAVALFSIPHLSMPLRAGGDYAIPGLSQAPMQRGEHPGGLTYGF
ncbi:hypothetical protein A9Q02_19680 [Candidatus Chloroploca asiatica]|uniref:Uncharacterized protein n=1 Tax=Candidatus Chloroploca asiatica TaxID=1506545 RepID=A0A2H3KXD4_9CHLR|nr:hypothetical protein A9Q02_19680 [Candidatus Chloroploca asiatica]